MKKLKSTDGSITFHCEECKHEWTDHYTEADLDNYNCLEDDSSECCPKCGSEQVVFVSCKIGDHDLDDYFDD